MNYEPIQLTRHDGIVTLAFGPGSGQASQRLGCPSRAFAPVDGRWARRRRLFIARAGAEGLQLALRRWPPILACAAAERRRDRPAALRARKDHV